MTSARSVARAVCRVPSGKEVAVADRYGGVESWLAAHDFAAARLLSVASDNSGRSTRAPAVQLPRTRSVGRLDAGEPVPVERCVPAGRQPFDLGADHLHLVTSLSAAAFTVLDQTGTLAPVRGVVPAPGDLDAFAAAYDWMRWQMALHLDDYRGGFPVWVWAKIRRADLVSNLRPRGADGLGSVAVTLSVPRDQVLLTDYMSWHDVLNGLPGLPERCQLCRALFCEDQACLDRWYDGWADGWDVRVPRDDQGQRRAWWEWPVELQSELFATWEVVRHVRRRWPVQGCLERIEAAWISSVQRPR